MKNLRHQLRRFAPTVAGMATVVAGFTALQIGLSPDSRIAAAPIADRPSEITANRSAERSGSLDTSTDTSVVLAAVTDEPAVEATTTTTVVETTLPPVTEVPQTTTTSIPANSQSGQASYYDYKAGGCAHKTIPKGTVVTVTNTATGQSATCVVNDRGPFVTGRIIDLDTTVFKQLASPSAGVFSASITW